MPIGKLIVGSINMLKWAATAAQTPSIQLKQLNKSELVTFCPSTTLPLAHHMESAGASHGRRENSVMPQTTPKPKLHGTLIPLRWVCSLNSCIRRPAGDLRFTQLCSDVGGCHSLGYLPDQAVGRGWTVEGSHWQLPTRPLGMRWLTRSRWAVDLKASLSDQSVQYRMGLLVEASQENESEGQRQAEGQDQRCSELASSQTEPRFLYK